MPVLKHIMLVEDEADIREIVKLSLEELGNYNVTAFDSGQAALEKVIELNPQLILLDVMMPGMSGLHTLERLNEIAIIKNTPVIFMTARIQPQQIDEYLKLGAIGIITKPFDPIAMVQEVAFLWNKMSKVS